MHLRRDDEFEVEKPKDTFRVISVGDSFTFGWGVANDETYPQQLEELLEALDLTPAEQERAGRLLRELCARVGTANAVGLGYVTLERATRTLSGGEAQRIQLAAALELSRGAPLLRDGAYRA